MRRSSRRPGMKIAGIMGNSPLLPSLCAKKEKNPANRLRPWQNCGTMSGPLQRGIEVVVAGLTRNFWKLRPFRPLKMSAAQGFARVRISQFHIVLACFSCILPEQGLHLRYTESCPRGRRCDTRNARWLWPFSPLKTLDL